MKQLYTPEQLLEICPVCGYDELGEPPYDTYGYPTYVICPCCGFEFGFDDSSKGHTFESYRNKWMDEGFKLFSFSLRKKEWTEQTMRAQLENIKRVSHYTPNL